MPNLSVPLSLIPRGIRVVQPERCLSSCDVGDSGFKARDFALEDLVLRRSGSVEILTILRTFCTNTLFTEPSGVMKIRWGIGDNYDLSSG